MKNTIKMGLFIAAMLFGMPNMNAQVSIGISISANIAPPPIPEYVQPSCPIDGYLWQPGYWAYEPDQGDYYWVPGAWIAPPSVGYLWTPCYWGYSGGVYVFHNGYWGPHVGFYGGINYGYGYYGNGFAGGIWYGSRFRYNTAVVHVNTRVIHNTYVDRTVISRNTIAHNRISYNGGRSGIAARPTTRQEQYTHEHHLQPTGVQIAHQREAVKNRALFASQNHGRPSEAALNHASTRHGNAVAANQNAPLLQETTQAKRSKQTQQQLRAQQVQHQQHAQAQQQQHAQQQQVQRARQQQQELQAQRVEQQQRAQQQHVQQQPRPQRQAPPGENPHERHR